MSKYQDLVQELEKVLVELDTVANRHGDKAKYHKGMSHTDTEMGQDMFHLAYAELNEGAERGLRMAIYKVLYAKLKFTQGGK